MSLKGKVAVVTGGNSGIGMAIVLALAKDGANIAIDHIAHPETAEALEQRVSAMGDQVIGVEADVSYLGDFDGTGGSLGSTELQSTRTATRPEVLLLTFMALRAGVQVSGNPNLARRA